MRHESFNQNHIFAVRVSVKRVVKYTARGAASKANRNLGKANKSENIGNGHTLAFVQTICFTMKKQRKDHKAAAR